MRVLVQIYGMILCIASVVMSSVQKDLFELLCEHNFKETLDIAKGLSTFSMLWLSWPLILVPRAMLQF